jgi:hypothetical protein
MTDGGTILPSREQDAPPGGEAELFGLDVPIQDRIARLREHLDPDSAPIQELPGGRSVAPGSVG